VRIARLGPGLAALALILAAVLRLYDLEHNPPGLYQDEASTGVDAYSIWNTGKDRAGERWPIIARSYGDYPFATYRYLTAPVVGLLGVTPGHERLMAGVLSFILVLALVFVLRRAFGPATALGALLGAAICPTWIHLARYGSEQILLPTTLMLAVAMFETGKQAGRRGWLWGGAIALGMSAFSYHAAKVLLPLWTLGYLVYFWPTLKALWPSEKRHVFGPLAIVMAFVIPSIMIAMTPEGNARARDAAAFFKLPASELASNIASLYALSWSPDRLFFSGPGYVTLAPPGIGMWAWSDLPLILLGLVAIARSLRGHPGRRLAVFFFYWFLIGPIPYALGYERDSITRLVGWFPAPQAIAGLGFGWLMVSTRLSRTRPYWVAGIVTVWLASSAWIVNRILVHYPKVAERQWQYEISGALKCGREYALSQQERPQIIVSTSFTNGLTFAQFWYADLPPLPDGRPAFVMAQRTELNKGEIFVAPSSVEQLKTADMVCTIKWYGSDPPSLMSHVYAPK